MKIKKILTLLLITISFLIFFMLQNYLPKHTELNREDKKLNIESLTLPKRLAFMSGHVHAGIELYKRNEFAMAAPHLMHPVSETHEAERVNLKK